MTTSLKTMHFQDTDALGIEIIDRQHQRFFELLGKLVAAQAAGSGREAVLEALDDMVTYVDEHFATEERYMREFDYADYTVHRELHASFVRKIIEMHRAVRRDADDLDDELVAYLGQWFKEHIRVEDPKYAALFRERGL
jgi:hemerythrin-like metal-binding protein